MKDLTKIQIDSIIKNNILVKIRLKSIVNFINKITKNKLTEL